MKKSFVLMFLCALFIFASFGARVHAATLFILPKSGAYNIGEKFSVDVKISAADEFLNASQATISFPPDILELVSADKVGSTFNFWVTEPTISNESGTVSFIGGTARGVSGGSLQVVRLTFKTKGAGVATLSISDAVIAASDGKGTNILAVAENASIRVGTQVVEADVPHVDAVPVIVPQTVTRTAISATKLPVAPVITVPLYKDSAQWYNTQGDTIALWEVTEDVSAVSVTLDKRPDTIPDVAEGELSTGKTFGVLSEGEWYVHARFKNNIGWGKTGHYRIRIDTTAPLPFDAAIDSVASDNPTPQVTFTAADSLSGIGAYDIYVDDERVLETTEYTARLSALSPGKHTLRVRAKDRAGNSTESVLPFEIVPLPTPTVHFYTETISQSETLFVSGTTLPEAGLVFSIKNSKGNEIQKLATNSDKNGVWEIRTVDTFGTGKYSFNVMVIDERGAQSFPTVEHTFRVRALVLFSVGSIDIGWFEILLAALLLILLFTVWFTVRLLRKNTIRSAYSTVISRDVLKFGVMIEQELEEIKKKISAGSTVLEVDTKSEITFRIDKIFEIVAKMKKYLSQEIGKLKV